MFTEKLSRLFTGGAIAALIVVGSTAALAQTTPPADTLAVNYFSNANTGAPDATVQIDNPGTSGGSLCAMIYVYAPDQQLTECCGCNITENGLLTLSVNGDLTHDPLTGVLLNSGTIKIVSSSGAPTCDPRKPTPTPALREWGTHILNSGAITETEFLTATLSSADLTKATNLCKSIIGNGSGSGICTCGVGD
jgi:hypothetical protein